MHIYLFYYNFALERNKIRTLSHWITNTENVNRYSRENVQTTHHTQCKFSVCHFNRMATVAEKKGKQNPFMCRRVSDFSNVIQDENGQRTKTTSCHRNPPRYFSCAFAVYVHIHTYLTLSIYFRALESQYLNFVQAEPSSSSNSLF